MDFEERCDNIEIIIGFFHLNRYYWKVGEPGCYIDYLLTILPEGRAVKSKNNYYFVSGDDVYKCGSDPEEFTKFKKFARHFRKNSTTKFI